MRLSLRLIMSIHSIWNVKKVRLQCDVFIVIQSQADLDLCPLADI